MSTRSPAVTLHEATKTGDLKTRRIDVADIVSLVVTRIACQPNPPAR
jgi:hypothetical protein